MHIRICYWSTDIRDKKILSDTCVWQINISLDIVSFFSDECSTGNYPYIFFFLQLASYASQLPSNNLTWSADKQY